MGIGGVSGASMAIYLPIIHRSSVYLLMKQLPFFDFSILWNRLGSAQPARSSAHAAGFNGPEIWLWVILLLGGWAVALMMQQARGRQAPNHESAATITAPLRADLALFCVVSMLLGIAGYMAFLMK